MRPPSVRAAGWTPCANSRSSRRAASSSVRSDSIGFAWGPAPVRTSSRSAATLSSRLSAPSRSSRSRRRSPASPASMMRRRDASSSSACAWSLGLQLRVHDGDPRCSSHRVDEVAVGREPSSWSRTANLLSVVLDRRLPFSQASRRELDGVAGVVDVRLGIRQSIADDKRRIAERERACREGSRSPGGAEVDDESGDDRLRPPGTEQVDHEKDGRGGDHEGVDPQEVWIRACQPSDGTDREHGSKGDSSPEREASGPACGTRRLEKPPQRSACDRAAQRERRMSFLASGSIAPSTYAATTTARARRSDRRPVG